MACDIEQISPPGYRNRFFFFFMSAAIMRLPTQLRPGRKIPGCTWRQLSEESAGGGARELGFGCHRCLPASVCASLASRLRPLGPSCNLTSMRVVSVWVRSPLAEADHWITRAPPPPRARRSGSFPGVLFTETCGCGPWRGSTLARELSTPLRAGDIPSALLGVTGLGDGRLVTWGGTCAGCNRGAGRPCGGIPQSR